MTIVVDPNDLAAHPFGGNKPVRLSRTIRNETELPQQVGVEFWELGTDYERGFEYASRLITDSVQLLDVPFNLALTSDDAAKKSSILLQSEWLERYQFEFSLPYFKYYQIEPTDIVEITIGNVTYYIRVTSVDVNLPVARYKGNAYDVSYYQSDAVGAVAPGDTTLITPPVAVNYVLNDWPSLRTDINEVGFYIAANSYYDAANFTAASLYVSDDNGQTYVNLGPVVNPAGMGVVTSAPASGITTTWDKANSFTVEMFNTGELTTVTDLQALNGSNYFALNREILTVQECSLIASTTYRCKRLLRGRFGTEHEVGNHQYGERFVVLNTNVFRYVVDDTQLNASRLYKIVPEGTYLENAAPFTFVVSGNALKPYSPVHIKGRRNAARNVTISWVRRERLYGEWLDYKDVPYSEADDLYDVDILDGTASVVRTFASVATTSQVYTAAQQTTDFGSTQEEVDVNIYKLSATVGRGYVGSATI